MSNTALVLIDMQNDFLHPEGAYARAGINCEAISALPAVLAPVCDAIRRSGDISHSFQVGTPSRLSVSTSGNCVLSLGRVILRLEVLVMR